MAFLGLFGKKDPLAAMEKAYRQNSWAEVLSYVDEINPDDLEAEAQERFQLWQSEAGDRLARFNLEEGGACARAGDWARAEEHYKLALEVARSAELQEQARAGLAQEPTAAPAPEPAPAKAGGCATCTPQPQAAEVPIDLPDEETRFELLLAGAPEELEARYRQTSAEFRQGLLLAHGGEEQEALDLWLTLPAEEQDGLFWQEVGQAQLRGGDGAAAEKSLKKALELEPGLQTAAMELAELYFAGNRIPALRHHLEQMLKDDLAPGYALGRLALLAAQEGNNDQALELGSQAMQHGDADGETLVLTASLLEQAGRLDEAEGLLQRLAAGGGCGGGGVHPLLAEFWLRQRKELNRALEAFKGVLRQEGDNPRWHMRLAQTYLAKGWKREGLPMLRKLLKHPELPDVLRLDAEEWLKEFGG